MQAPQPAKELSILLIHQFKSSKDCLDNIVIELKFPLFLDKAKNLSLSSCFVYNHPYLTAGQTAVKIPIYLEK